MLLGVCSPKKSIIVSFVFSTFREKSDAAIRDQLAHLHSVTCLIFVSDETHHSFIKLNEEIGAMRRCAVMGQQGKEQGAEYTCLPTRTVCGLPI